MKQKELIKPFTINLLLDDYELMKENAKERGMQESEYICFLVRSDYPKLYTTNAASGLKMITETVNDLTNGIQRMKKQDLEKLKEGVDKLWQSL